MSRDVLYWASVRYALGRRTYVVSDVAEAVIRDWDKLTKGAQETIQRDVDEAIAKRDTGMEMDHRQWLEVQKLWTPEVLRSTPDGKGVER